MKKILAIVLVLVLFSTFLLGVDILSPVLSKQKMFADECPTCSWGFDTV